MRRVVITGIGVVAPGGVGRETFWQTLVEGKSTADRLDIEGIERFRSQIACAVTDWEPRTCGLSEEEAERWDRHIQFGLVAAQEAWLDSGLLRKQLDPERCGVAAGTAISSTIRLEQEYLAVSRQATEFIVDPSLASPYLYHAVTPSSLSAAIASQFQLYGPVTTVSTGCTAGMDAVAQAFEWIRDGDADVMVAGASEAGIAPINMASFDAIKATSTRNDDPKRASRPFDGKRNGFVLGEGCAFLILEELEAAQMRNAHIYAEISGYGSALNAYHMTGLPKHGQDMIQAIYAALNDAALEPNAVQYINAHGSSTAQNDIHETNAFKAIWGKQAYDIPVSSIKSMIGHSLGAIGAIEIAACALTIERGIIPPTINHDTPDPACDLDYVANTARNCAVDVVVSTASGFGGFQSAIVIARVKDDSDD